MRGMGSEISGATEFDLESEVEARLGAELRRRGLTNDLHRKAVLMAAERQSVRQIAETLGEPVATVQGWFLRGAIHRAFEGGIKNVGPKVRDLREEIRKQVASTPPEILGSDKPRARPVQVDLSPRAVEFLLGQYRGEFRRLGEHTVARSRTSAGSFGPLRGHLLERGGVRYPVAFFPAGENRSLDGVLALEDVDASRPDLSALIRDQRDPTWFQERRDRFEPAFNEQENELRYQNLWNLCVRESVATPEGPRLRASLARYDDIMDSCDAMISELADVDQHLAPGMGIEGEWPQKFPVRSGHHRVSRQCSILTDGSRRAAGLGISAAVVFAGEDSQLYVLIAQRSTGVATYSGCWNLLPAGMAGWRFAHMGQPDAPSGTTLSETYKASYLENAILREYSEELYREPERPFEDEKRVRATDCIQRLLERWKPRVEFTGIATDLVNLRFEVCALIFIDDPAWFPSECDLIRGNWEHRGAAALGRLPVGDSPGGAAEQLVLSTMTPGNTVPTGAAALWAGIDRARTLHAARPAAVPERPPALLPAGPLFF
jgi:hypothetical protein